MLITGIVLGPYVLDFLDSSILSISADLRKMALIIILLKAGLSLDLNDLKKVGRPAIMLSFVPASFEIIGYVLLAPWILGITHVEADCYCLQHLPAWQPVSQSLWNFLSCLWLRMAPLVEHSAKLSDSFPKA